MNLAAGQGHPAAAMDMSFANLALAVEHLVHETPASCPPRVLDVPREIDDEIARLKLASLGVEIDSLTPEQEDYLASWGAQGAQRVVDPLVLAPAAHPVVDLLGPEVVLGGRPLERHAAAAPGPQSCTPRSAPRPFRPARVGAGTKRSFITAIRPARASTSSSRRWRSPAPGPSSSRPMIWKPSQSGSASSERASASSSLVARLDLVEVAVAAHEREQLGEVVLRDRGDAHGRAC